MLRPARGGAAGVVVVFAILLTLAAKADSSVHGPGQSVEKSGS